MESQEATQKYKLA